MNIKFDEDNNAFTVDMQDTFFLGAPSVLYDPSTWACDCTPKVNVVIEQDQVLDPKDITIWNLMFNKRVKTLLKNSIK
jgi:hypothetical protein